MGDGCYAFNQFLNLVSQNFDFLRKQRENADSDSDEEAETM